MDSKKGGRPYKCEDFACGFIFPTDDRDEFALRVAKRLAKKAGCSHVKVREDGWSVNRHGETFAWHYEATFLSPIRGNCCAYSIKGRTFLTVYAVGV